MLLILDREIATPKWNMGSLVDSSDRSFKLATLENTWLNNEPFISCIPAGSKICKRVDSPRYGNTFEVTDVEGRTHILFHWGNYEKNTLGCILLGMEQAPEEDMIKTSRKGFGQFIKYTSTVNEFELLIRET